MVEGRGAKGYVRGGGTAGVKEDKGIEAEGAKGSG